MSTSTTAVVAVPMFVMQTLQPYSCTVVLGKVASGKSHLVPYILRQLDAAEPVHHVIGIAVTRAAQDAMKRWGIPESDIYNDDDDDDHNYNSVLESVIDRIRRLSSLRAAKHVVVVLDEIAIENDHRLQQNLSKLQVLSTSCKLSLVVSTQYKWSSRFYDNCGYQFDFTNNDGTTVGKWQCRVLNSHRFEKPEQYESTCYTAPSAKCPAAFPNSSVQAWDLHADLPTTPDLLTPTAGTTEPTF